MNGTGKLTKIRNRIAEVLGTEDDFYIQEFMPDLYADFCAEKRLCMAAPCGCREADRTRYSAKPGIGALDYSQILGMIDLQVSMCMESLRKGTRAEAVAC